MSSDRDDDVYDTSKLDLTPDKRLKLALGRLTPGGVLDERLAATIDRNSLCLCGSGKKTKKCCRDLLLVRGSIIDKRTAEHEERVAERDGGVKFENRRQQKQFRKRQRITSTSSLTTAAAMTGIREKSRMSFPKYEEAFDELNLDQIDLGVGEARTRAAAISVDDKGNTAIIDMPEEVKPMGVSPLHGGRRLRGW